MAQAGVIRDFMVALGFKTDNSGLNQMQGAMNGLELKATALKGALLALATGAVVAVRQTAGELDKLYYSSQRIGASVTNINAYGNAIAQLGGSAEGAIGSLESLAEKMRNSPGYESQIKSLGVDTRNANGEMRDRVEMMKDLSGVLSKMPAYQANAYASSLGIDQNTLLAMRDGKFMSNMEKYQKIQKELGMNDDLAKSGNEFMAEYRDLTMMTKTGFQVIVMQAGKALIPILRLLNQLIQAGIQAFSQLNPEIKQGLAVGLRFAMLAVVFGGFIKVFGLLFKFIPAIKSLIGLIKLLNLAFLASPIGIVLALAAAIGVLWDDYSTWKDGGKSFIDWSKWTQEIDWVVEKIQELIQWIQNLTKIALDWSLGDGTYDSVVDFTSRKIIEPIVEGVKKVTGSGDTNSTQNAVTPSELGKSAAVGIAKVLNNEVKGVAKDTVSSSQKITSLIATEGKKRIYQMADGSTETRTGGTVAWRNNNPGNLKLEFKGSADKTVKSKRSKEKALKDAQKRYDGVVALDQWGNAIFETMEAGAVAKAQLLKTQHKGKTYQQMLRKYAVNDYSGKTNYTSYEKTIHDTAKGMGVSLEGKTIGQMTDKEFQALAAGMVKAEGLKVGSVQKTGGVKHALPTNSRDLAKFAQNADIPSGNPHKSQIANSNITASNVTIHQSFKTDMTLNGVSSPMESVNAVKRQQENDLAIMARGAKGVFTG
ncbi:phage tail tape measure protein [Acinetobacter faecalis]|uniref:phage tail tape measure protein n=1 Tax=Acinetobacter faecalis TaxID=2665161 RepID=UPI002A91F423|nr:phage tail tape measure protein [Acinetobacter faecalis]MDY6450714.1 phage tail tape measure protein [Acinetobacter faecalis]